MAILPMDAFFKAMWRLRLALAFDDVRLPTDYTEVHPDNVLLDTRFALEVPLKQAVVSSPMDRVTEYEMAIAIAQVGGIGILHRNLSPEQQATQVNQVKLRVNGRVDSPITVRPDETIAEILNRRERHNFKFHSFPVVDDDNRVIGILTKDNFDKCIDKTQTAGQVMTKNPRTAPSGTTVEQAFHILQEIDRKLLPIVDAEGRLIALYAFTDLKRVLFESEGSTQLYNLDERGNLRVGAAIGFGESEMDRLDGLVEKRVDVVVIDVKHADCGPVYEMIQAIRSRYPLLQLVVGNISGPESAKRLARAGVHGLKVGQGCGSICSSGVIAGTGSPQLTAIYECAKAVRDFGIPVCADGGIRFSGDITKALAAGGHSVMLGNLLAGTTESPGELTTYRGIQVKDYRGMGSESSLRDSIGSRQRYKQENSQRAVVPEGVEGVVPYSGGVEDLIFQLMGGLRSGMSDIGAGSIDELHRKADFRFVTANGRSEGHPHSITITRDQPNYMRPM